MASGATDRAPDYFLPGRVDEVAAYGSALAAARCRRTTRRVRRRGVEAISRRPRSPPHPRPAGRWPTLTVAFNGSLLERPGRGGTIASYAWDLDGDGQFDDSTAAQPSFQ